MKWPELKKYRESVQNLQRFYRNLQKTCKIPLKFISSSTCLMDHIELDYAYFSISNSNFMYSMMHKNQIYVLILIRRLIYVS